MSNYPELKGKVAVISGAGGNLGAAVARRLHADGVKLALADRNQERVHEFVHSLGIADGDAFLAPVDLSKKAEVDKFIDNIVDKFGQIDILVNTAGGYKPGVPVHEMDESFWDSMLTLNSKTAFLLCGAVARTMVAKGNIGRIVNVAGRAGLSAFATGAAYAAGKASMLRLTEAMSGELLSRGITVNAVLPSTIDTPQNRAGEPNADFSKWVSPESIADVIAFLASDAARDISGASIPIYGKS
ncbi:MAG: SDR family NAD(P)-dependent oxidoreductase [Chloroflexota bacterium]